MNREQAALYDKIESQFPGALKTLLPDVPLENYKFIKAFGEGKTIKLINSAATHSAFNFMSSAEHYIITQPKRYCNGVELDECITGIDADDAIDYIFCPRPDLLCGFERVAFDHINREWLALAQQRGFVYSNAESAIKHAEAMRIVEVRDE
jgi:hypothetical protein